MKGSEFNEKNISAEKEACKDGTRFQKENVNQKRKKSIGTPPCKGQKAAFLLIYPNGY